MEAHLRQRYDEVWMDIRRELDKHAEQRYSDLIQGAGDPEDAATADVLLELNLAEIQRDAQELMSLQDALGRLKRGEYGFCQRCGDAVAPGRLEALPHATLCVDCQSVIERARGPDPTPSL